MSVQYNLYLKEHIGNVLKAFEWLKKNIPEVITECDFSNIHRHDASKYQTDEYYPYDAYFYGGNKSYDVVNEFNNAWLKHIHRNPHHWQHWVLVNDDPKKGSVGLAMPYNYIIEMICDWWTFSWKSGNLYEIFDWYDKHKDYMILHDSTRKSVEHILNQIKEKLDSEKK